jgi:hypothetical protein
MQLLSTYEFAEDGVVRNHLDEGGDPSDTGISSSRV